MSSNAREDEVGLHSTVVSIVVNVISSVSLILLVKQIVSVFGFNFTSVLTFFHCATAFIIIFTVTQFTGQDKNASPKLSRFDCYSVAVGQTASVILMNVSLSVNSVGFYQIAKLAIVPVMMVIQVSFFGQNWMSMPVNLSVLVLLVGVGIATVTDVSVKFFGLLMAASAIIVTAVHQIRVSSLQSKYKIQSYTMMIETAFPLVITSGIAALVVEVLDLNETTLLSRVLLHHFMDMSTREIVFILISCIAAIVVNFSSFYMLKATSPVTFQIVGHGKTCGIIAFGLLFFPIKQSTEQLLKNIFGISLAMAGTIAYSYFKNMENAKAKESAPTKPEDKA